MEPELSFLFLFLFLFSVVFYYHMALILHLGLLFYEIFPTDDVNYAFRPGHQFTDFWNKTK